MLGALIIVVVLLIVIPVAVLISMGVIAAILGGVVKSGVDVDNAGTEQLELSEHYPGRPAH